MGLGGAVDIALQPQIFSCKYEFFFHNKMPPPSAHVKHEWSYTSSPPIRLRGMYREHFNFLPSVLHNTFTKTTVACSVSLADSL